VEGDLESARALYERILAIDPDHDIPWRGLSEISRQQEDYEAAFQYLLDGLRRWDTNVNSLLAFGQLATRVRRYDLAEWAFLRARRIQPDSELAQLGLGLVRESRNSPAESESAPPKAGSRR
jgi:tetratricopeptide (TPR) repeat protein